MLDGAAGIPAVTHSHGTGQLPEGKGSNEQLHLLTVLNLCGVALLLAGVWRMARANKETNKKKSCGHQRMQS